MHFDQSVIRWTLGLCLDIVVAIAAVRSGLFKRLPVFTIYLFLVVACDFLTTIFRGVLEHRPLVVFYEYWAGEALLIGMRAAAVGEICFQLFGPYRGIWRLCRLFLGVAAALLLAAAAYSGVGQQYLLPVSITVLQRGLELAIVGTLAFALLFARYYELKIERFMMLIIGGLFFYSAVQIGNSQLMSQLKGPYYAVYAGLTLVSFDIASLVWLAAVWKPVPVLATPSRASETDTFGVSIPEMNARLRELNARLSEIMR